MLFLLALTTVSYLAVVIWVRRSRRPVDQATTTAEAVLPVADRPPLSAVGWPPAGSGFTPYVDQGFAALDDYLSEGYAA